VAITSIETARKGVEKEPKCCWCDTDDHTWLSCPRVRRLKFYGDEVEYVEFWPTDDILLDLDPDDDGEFFLQGREDDE
jgi:hypothetical protein